MKPFRLEARLRNNRILRRIEEILPGLSIPKAAEYLKYSYVTLIRFISFKEFPLLPDRIGSYCAVFGCGVEPDHSQSPFCSNHRKSDQRNLYLSKEANFHWRNTALSLAEKLAVEPEWLWPEEARAVQKSKSYIELTNGEICSLLPGTNSEFYAFDLQDKIENSLKILSPREEKVLRERFGIGDGYDEKTLEEIAIMFEVGKERIRQIEAKALRKLRRPENTKKVKGWVR